MGKLLSVESVLYLFQFFTLFSLLQLQSMQASNDTSSSNQPEDTLNVDLPNAASVANRSVHAIPESSAADLVSPHAATVQSR